ncbi:hypothetical protein D9753_07990 [Streptomyces dangxiongensis]|uniref:Translation initiation factor 2 n=1 Tax=Streptomyces dangxiongensis TaxID=1442032 RepID=A0A3G2JGW6_9ACTN|nr:hypothetical protein [Streptomyces dangxiongensis]AYN38867.1 hypothetical protein D9753_07990 [Streptomyces dangxiongensis]
MVVNGRSGPHLRVPVGDDAHRWSTFRGEKTLIVAARTVTSTARVLECLPALLRGDSRVTVVFAYDPTSAFSDGVLDLLHDAGCRIVPWSQLGSIAPDLILSASENIDVPEGDCPVLVLPHGVGFQKLVPDSRAPRSRLSGVVPDSLLESGRAWLAVSHPDQEQQLLATHPKTAGRTLLIGDPCFDELTVSLPQAAAYRRALGVADGRRLVVVSSTWGPTSLLGRYPQLPAELLAALPYDEYRVAAVIHPNVWSAHGSWQIRTLQAAALEAGLLLMPPVHAWRSALVAASVVVGDHGSVTLMGAALGKPVLLAAFGSDAVPGTAVAHLGQAAPQLDDPRGDLRQQIEDAVQGHIPERYAAICDLAFAEPGLALTRLRATLYRLLKLAEPTSNTPPVLSLPHPDPPAATVTSWLVTTAATAAAAEHSMVAVRRHPAAVSGDRQEAADTFVHLACDEEERDHRLTESASVVVRRRPADTAVSALGWIRETLHRLPGSLVAAVPLNGNSFLLGTRDGPIVEATVTGPTIDPGLPAALVYTCLRAGLPLDGVFMTLRIGDVREEVGLRLRLPSDSRQ